MGIFHLDYETYSEADLKNWGAYRYAVDPSTEILMFAIARGDEEPVLWDILDSFSENAVALNLLHSALKNKALIYAHNAQFEIAISKYLFEKTFGYDAPSLDQWRCTAAMCRRAAIPSSLQAAGEFLGLDVAKDKMGAALIRKFSIPRKPTKKDPRTRVFPSDNPEEFKGFGLYCKTDVKTERALHQKLKAFELKGEVLRSFQFDQKMNDYGIPVNVPMLGKVNNMINEYSKEMTDRFGSYVGLNPTQRDKCLEWFRKEGYPYQNLQAPNVEEILKNGPKGWEARYIEHERELEGKIWAEQNPDKTLPSKFTALKLQPVDISPMGFEMLEVRSRVSYAAIKKIPTMLNAACPDRRVRGCLLWSGAERTHRWAGRIIQPQNFRRPTFKGTEQAYKMLCEGADVETIEMLFGPFLEVIASCIRHFIQEPAGGLLQADFSSVEARGAPWLCGAEGKLKMFRENKPVYETMAAKIFGVPVKQIEDEHENGDSEKRFIGKQAELGCTYNMGGPKFRGTCEGYNYSPSQKMVNEFRPKYYRQLKHLESMCLIKRQFTENEIKFPPYPCARLENKKLKNSIINIKPAFSVWAYRKGGTPRKIKDPQNPTSEEWLDLTYDNLAHKAVYTWRKDNSEIVQAWKDLDIAAKKAIQNPGKIFRVTDKISLGVTEKPGFRALLLNLPSGHNLVYPHPRLVWKGAEGVKKDTKDYYNIQIEFWGKVPNKSNWGWCKTYGGKLLENATQAICGDLMANGACNASSHNYNIFMLVHDESIGPRLEGQDQKTLCKLLCDLPEWAEGFPLEAEGNNIPFYKKT